MYKKGVSIQVVRAIAPSQIRFAALIERQGASAQQRMTALNRVGRTLDHNAGIERERRAQTIGRHHQRLVGKTTHIVREKGEEG